MRKISAMYQYSGGTKYNHRCGECRNCVKVRKGNKSVYKCLAYGNTNSEASDWKVSYIACKLFNQPIPQHPVIRTVKREQDEENLEGQLSFEDFPEVMP